MSEFIDVSDLEDLMDWYRRMTPSAPDWYYAIDHVVGVLLQLEIERRRAALNEEVSG